MTSPEGSDQLGYSTVSESEFSTENCEYPESNEPNNGGPESDASADNSTSIQLRPDSVPSPLPQPSQWPKKLLATVIDDIQWLYDYAGKVDTKTAIQNRREEKKDERIEDIQRVEGRRLPSNEDRIFRALAQRSMGIQFTQIQRDANLKTRVDELVESVQSSDPDLRARLLHKRTKFVSKHLDRFQHAQEDREIVLRGIHSGVKRLTVEALFAQRLLESRRPIKPEGISAFTALKVNPFDRLLYEDIPCFLDHIFRCEVELNAQPKQGHQKTIVLPLPDALVALSTWMQKFQGDYDNDRFVNKETNPLGTTLESGPRSSMHVCLSSDHQDVAMQNQPSEDETMPDGQVARTVVHRGTTNAVQFKTAENNVAGRCKSLECLYRAPHVAAGTLTERGSSKSCQKRLHDDETIATEPARKRSTTFQSSSGQRETTPDFDPQAGNIDTDGIQALYNHMNKRF
jgi:hypothetical protein